jgi:hypothetical protein
MVIRWQNGLSFGIVPRNHDLSSGGTTSNEEKLTQTGH